VLEVVDAVIAAVGADKVGVRLSPQGVFNDIDDPESTAMALYLAKAFTQRNLAFLHIAEPDWSGGAPLTREFRLHLRWLQRRNSGSAVRRQPGRYGGFWPAIHCQPGFGAPDAGKRTAQRT
jgi:2,4-dienoyl-CoA reductase-like NADH-dependent reductase (Old Yellow Enzyme family)